MADFRLDVESLHWIVREAPDTDLCLHGLVTVEFGGERLVGPEDGEFTVSSSALYLLRTLEIDHRAPGDNDEMLVPHCGHFFFDLKRPVVIPNCNLGVDWSVERAGDVVRLTSVAGARASLPFESWRDAVLRFSDAVEGFYAAEPPRVIADPFKRVGYVAFREEWKELRCAAESRHGF